MSEGEIITGGEAVDDGLVRPPTKHILAMSPRELRAQARRAERDAAMVDEVVATVRGSKTIKFAVLGMKPFILARLKAEEMTIDDLRRVLNTSASRVIEEILQLLNGKNGRS